jgi:hypothetical protein
MADNVIDFGGITKLPLRPERILGAAYDYAVKDEFSDVIVIGWRDGEFYLAGSSPELGEALILVENARHAILDMVRGQHSD